MKTPAGVPAEPLVMLQLKVARRADKLAAHLSGGPISLNLSCWLKAEAEIFACALAPTSLPNRPTPGTSSPVQGIVGGEGSYS